MKTSRLIIASNRGPVEFYLDHDKRLKEHRSPGGLITVLRNAYKLAMTEGDRIASKQMWEYNNRIVRSHFCNDNKMRIQYVAISKTAYHKHYDVISNQLLWFLQHYQYNFIPEDVFVTHHIQDAWINGYRVANQAVADAVSQEIDSDGNSDISVVMLHDSHLYLAPRFIRKLQPLSIITQFIHIPWPDVRWWHFLPSNIEHDIYSSLVSGDDIIGFQTALDASNFIEGARSLLKGAVINFEEGVISWQGHHTHIRVYPISISVVDERRVVQRAAGKRAAAKILRFLGEKHYEGRSHRSCKKYPEWVPWICRNAGEASGTSRKGGFFGLSFCLHAELYPSTNIIVRMLYRLSTRLTRNMVRLNGYQSVRSWIMIGLAHYLL